MPDFPGGFCNHYSDFLAILRFGNHGSAARVLSVPVLLLGIAEPIVYCGTVLFRAVSEGHLYSERWILFMDTPGPLSICLTNMVIVFGVLIFLAFVIELIHIVDPTKKKK